MRCVLPPQITVLANVMSAEAKVLYLMQLLHRAGGGPEQGGSDGSTQTDGHTAEHQPRSHGQP